MRKHKNNTGFHFYLPVNPFHVFGIDFYFARLNLFFPFYISISFGILGHKGFMIGGGVKYDPTETLKLDENDYVFSAHLRIHRLGYNCRVNSEASL